ncbi:hypothetical protein [Streptomyces sp. HUAS ZL42]
MTPPAWKADSTAAPGMRQASDHAMARPLADVNDRTAGRLPAGEGVLIPE